MNREKTLLYILFVFTTILHSQNEQLLRYKKELPKVIDYIEQLQVDKGSFFAHQENEKVIDSFQKPWEMNLLNKELAKDILDVLEKNKSYHVKRSYYDPTKWNFIFSCFSARAAGEKIRNFFFRYDPYPNLFITISNIKLVDSNNVSIAMKKETRTDVVKDAMFNNVVRFDGYIPITDKSEKIHGSIDLSLKTFKKIDHKSFNKEDKEVAFNLGDIEGLQLIKIEKNKAYFYLPKYIDDIEIVSTNKKEKMFAVQQEFICSKIIVDYAMGGKVKKKSTELLIENIKEEDLIDKPQILIHETNGTIENLYIYKKSNPVILNSKKIEISI